MFTQALENVKPAIEVRSKRVGGASYQVPMQVSKTRQQSLAIRWLLGAVREKKGRPKHLALAEELVAAYNKEGAAMTKRKTFTVWPKQTRHLPTSPGKSFDTQPRFLDRPEGVVFSCAHSRFRRTPIRILFGAVRHCRRSTLT